MSSKRLGDLVRRSMRFLSVTAAGCALVGAATITAPAASAASATALCFGDESASFDLAAGETFTLTVSGACGWLAPGVGNFGSTTYGPVTGDESVLPSEWTEVAPPVTAVFTQPACGVPEATTDALYVAFDARPNPAVNLGLFALTYTPAACGSGPADVIQQVGASPDGSCTITDAALNIGGAESGGWGASWAQWMNEGKGGAVCTRTLTYSANSGHWVVAG